MQKIKLYLLPTILTAISLIFLINSIITSADTKKENAAEAAGALLTSLYMTKALKNTECGYAILLDIDQFLSKTEQDIIENIPDKHLDSLTKIMPSINELAKDMTKDLLEKNKPDLDNRTRCGLAAGIAIGNMSVYLLKWEEAKNKL